MGNFFFAKVISHVSIIPFYINCILHPYLSYSFLNIAFNCIFPFCYIDSVTIIFNGCVTLCRLNIPTFVRMTFKLLSTYPPLISNAENAAYNLSKYFK